VGVVSEGVTLIRASDPGEAEAVAARVYLPNRLALSKPVDTFTMNLAVARVGGSTVGRLSYGQSVHLVTEEARHFHVNTPLAGRALSKAGESDRLATGPGQAAVFPPGAPADIRWTDDCVQMCLMIPQTTLESELEELIGRPLTRPLRFRFGMDLNSPHGRSWWEILALVERGLDGHLGIATHALAGRHVERLLLDALLLGQQHNYADSVNTPPARAATGPIARAVELVHDRPGDPWSSTVLAREVHLSVRTLQEGFKRDVGRPPMTYLREVRLRGVRKDLQRATPNSTTVEAVAYRWGLVHMSRFAAAYRSSFGESPSETLRRSTSRNGSERPSVPSHLGAVSYGASPARAPQL
jgi:AraC-like DNA-binding protein